LAPPPATMSVTTPYRVSTITAIGSVGTPLNLDVLFEEVEINPEGLVHIQYKGNKDRTNEPCTVKTEKQGVSPDRARGTLPESVCLSRSRMKRHHRTPTQGKIDSNEFGPIKQPQRRSNHFDNQATVIVVLPSEHQTSTNCLNMKVFRNGNIQITGIKYVEQGEVCIQMLVSELHRIESRLQLQADTESERHVAEHPGALSCCNYRVCLINSDFKTGFQVKREVLFDILVSKYMVMCCYDPCIYPGVKIQYCWNDWSCNLNGESEPKKHDGVCKCTRRCNGKGRGSGDGDCRRITIAVFRSGCIIITGAHTYKQLDDAYAYVRRILETHMQAILHCPISLNSIHPK